jgi:hypothetical protein
MYSVPGAVKKSLGPKCWVPESPISEPILYRRKHAINVEAAEPAVLRRVCFLIVAKLVLLSATSHNHT